eukprot:1422161-Prymnesium_polylepis.1
MCVHTACVNGLRARGARTWHACGTRATTRVSRGSRRAPLSSPGAVADPFPYNREILNPKL